MSKREMEKRRTIQISWIFLVLGGLIGIFLGLTVNSMYDILREYLLPLHIFIIFAAAAAFLIDYATFQFFDNYDKFMQDADGSQGKIIKQYINFRGRKLLVGGAFFLIAAILAVWWPLIGALIK